ncbi:MAG: L,D-transpeptidase family protein [Campylobacterota bacterium]|nr:L,D-transpeptidase family protein [Campylobacterota bacterium]
MRYILILNLLFLINNLNAKNIDILKLQEQFNKKVHSINPYKKRYNSYLLGKCHDDIYCYEKEINSLKNWESVKNDQSLNIFLYESKKLAKFDQDYWNKLEVKLLQSKSINGLNLTNSQFVSVIDLGRQIYTLTVWDALENKFIYIGKDLISSGNIYREAEIRYGENHYFKTPSGVFSSKTGWRSDGKFKDDNITLGYGHKGRFVFYFGKQKSIRYNTFDKDGNKLKSVDSWKLITDNLQFALHSHQSSKSLGAPHSHGCVRMSDELNRFLDNNHVFHKNMFKNKIWMEQYTNKPNNPKNKKLSGEYLFVFNKI